MTGQEEWSEDFQAAKLEAALTLTKRRSIYFDFVNFVYTLNN
jgi:3-methyladenine DNA glycosylase AlkD